MTKTTFISRAKVLVALGVTSLALAAAGPASAADSQVKPPTDKNGKKSCALYDGDKVSGWVGHGGTWTNPSGSLTTKCTDGEWVAVRTASTQRPSGYETGNEPPSGYMTGNG